MVPENRKARVELVATVRGILTEYGRDYSIGAIHGLAVRNMVSVKLPEVTPGFYPIVKIHEMAITELEEVFYGFLEVYGDKDGGDNDGGYNALGDKIRAEIISLLVAEKVWE
jgi:hypothetical protein